VHQITEVVLLKPAVLTPREALLALVDQDTQEMEKLVAVIKLNLDMPEFGCSCCGRNPVKSGLSVPHL